MKHHVALPVAALSATLVFLGVGSPATNTGRLTKGLDPSKIEAAVQAGYTSLDVDANPLRLRFNADVRKTRVLMYVSPT